MSPHVGARLSIARLLLIMTALTVGLIVLMKAIFAVEQPSQGILNEERKFSVQEYKDMPLEVKVRNLQSKSWHKDLEIEVKNTSKRRIYFILAYLTFPDDVPPRTDDEVGFALHFGTPENIRISHLADPEDEHLEPNEKYVFTFPTPERIGFEARHRKYPGPDKHLRFRISLVSFGDGTGWEAGSSRDTRKKITGGSASLGKKSPYFNL